MGPEEIVGIVTGRMMTIHSSGHTVFGFTHIEGIKLGAGEKFAEGANGLWLG